MMKIEDLQAALQVVLVECAQERGVTSGWMRRHGKLSPSQFVQTLVFGFLEDPHASEAHLARVACATGAAVTQEAICQRFTAASVDMLKGVLQDALGRVVQAEPVAVELLQPFPGGVYLSDSTQVHLPDDWASIWDGGSVAAALKIPAVVEMTRGGLHLDLTAARQHDSQTRLANVTFPSGSVVIEDQGYLNLARMQTRQAQGVATIVPLRCTMALFDEHERRIHLVSWLKRHPGERVERQVRIQEQSYRLVACPVSAETAVRKRAGIRRDAQQHGRKPHPDALVLANWVVILTTAPPDLVSQDQVAVLMRLRWQIELVFKLWKDQGKLDETRGWKPERIETELYAKLLGLLVQHWMLLMTGWQWADRSWVLAGQAIREYGRSLCLIWQDCTALTHVCASILRAIDCTGRIASHSGQISTAVKLVRS